MLICFQLFNYCLNAGKIDMSLTHKDTRGYAITDKGNKLLEEYFSIEFREIRDLSESLRGAAYVDVKKFWEKRGREY